MGQFFPALCANAMIDRPVFGVPFHNSTPLLYVNVERFNEAGLDTDRLPQTWDTLAAAGLKLTKREGDNVSRWGIKIPSNFDYLGWMMSALTMSTAVVTTMRSLGRATTHPRCWAR
jgi:sn-glycerol 3-phosphate transport system substrate-binding protein